MIFLPVTPLSVMITGLFGSWLSSNVTFNVISKGSWKFWMSGWKFYSQLLFLYNSTIIIVEHIFIYGIHYNENYQINKNFNVFQRFKIFYLYNNINYLARFLISINISGVVVFESRRSCPQHVGSTKGTVHREDPRHSCDKCSLITFKIFIHPIHHNNSNE